jgi:NAD(P)-dependent dehydrogenase (short-subunit alcohol dehydrogenase family)
MPIMSYFVTGGTGFIGRRLVRQLAARGQPVHVLVRAGSRARLEELIRACGPNAGRIVPIEGDLTQDQLGLTDAARGQLRGMIRHFLHLGALYDMTADAAELERANVLGTHNALHCAQGLQAGCFHHVSSIAVAGCYQGTFTEDMFEQAEGLDHPYFRSKYASEALVRSTTLIPWRIYRPGMVVGDSTTGAMDKVDGPYYLFKALQKLRNLLPQWMPMIGFEGGHINLVPVDFVATALAHLVHVPGQDGRCFHLTDPRDRRVGEVLNLFARAAHAPTMALRLEPALLAALPRLRSAASQALAPIGGLIDQVLSELGIPKAIVALLNYPTRFDAARAQGLLSAAGIELPALEEYAWRLWDYWERHLDPDLFRSQRLLEAVQGKTVLVTGGSSGIGRATALKLAQAGARVLIVARAPEKLARVQAEARALGQAVGVYACDLADPRACESFVARLLAEHGHVDILINNAGRSIRRAIEHSYARLHDFERLMRLNYFAAVAVTLGLLPAMVKQGAGHVINISSIGVLSNAVRFAGYNASKAALEAFSRCAGGEYRARGIQFTIINMPLVRTPMVAPTRIYERFALMDVDQAAELVAEAIVRKPERLATGLGMLAAAIELLAPRINRSVMSEGFRMFPESAAAGGPPSADAEASPAMLAFASLLRGVHW